MRARIRSQVVGRAGGKICLGAMPAPILYFYSTPKDSDWWAKGAPPRKIRNTEVVLDPYLPRGILFRGKLTLHKTLKFKTKPRQPLRFSVY
jgi:hypothetical protein